MYAAVTALERQHAAHVVVAVPVATREAVAALAPMVDEVVTVMTPEPFYGVGAWYEDFGQTTDAEVRRLLARGRRAPGAVET
jgi:putative phosphoribosyl transferase